MLLYELVADRNASIDPEKVKFSKAFEVGFEAYLAKRWGEAQGYFEQLQNKYPEDKSVSIDINHCQYFYQNPDQIPADWDGSMTLKSK